jgi:dimeric dUTPase (all-alpha-NTP-PPase superfamily)
VDLSKLFEMQKVLRARINYNEPDRFNKLILALIVELGELANEHRGFKFWSQDQSPRTHKSRVPYMDLDDADFYNPLLEEYVDGLHFVLELGIEKGFEDTIPYKTVMSNTTRHFINLNDTIIQFYFYPTKKYYHRLIDQFLGLGEMLGFTGGQIEQAYMSKNAVNHKRQESGY